MDWLTDTADFVARSDCSNWPAWLIVASVSASLGIAAVYVAIPVILIVRSRRKGAKHRLNLVFAAFIGACGVSHGLDALMFFMPMYRLTAVWLVVTFAVSALAFTNLLSDTLGEHDGRS